MNETVGFRWEASEHPEAERRALLSGAPVEDKGSRRQTYFPEPLNLCPSHKPIFAQPGDSKSFR